MKASLILQIHPKIELNCICSVHDHIFHIIATKKMDFLMMITLAYGSFQLYYCRAKESGTENIKKKVRWNKIAVRWMKFFVVTSLYLTITHFLNQVFEDFIIYSILRGVICIWLMYTNANGASFVFDFITKQIISHSSFLLEFAMKALDEKVGVDVQCRIFFAHMVELFQEQYNAILSSISLEYPH